MIILTLTGLLITADLEPRIYFLLFQASTLANLDFYIKNRPFKMYPQNIHILFAKNQHIPLGKAQLFWLINALTGSAL